MQIYEKANAYQVLDNVFNNIENYNLVSAIKSLEILYKDKDYINEMLDYINVIMLDKAINNVKYVEYINIVEEVKKKLKANCNYDMCIDSLLFNIW